MLLKNMTIYPSFSHSDGDLDELLVLARKRVEKFGASPKKGYKAYNPGGGIHCDIPENLEIVFTDLGGPAEASAVQIFSGKTVVLSGITSCVSDRCDSVSILEPSNHFGEGPYRYTVKW